MSRLFVVLLSAVVLTLAMLTTPAVAEIITLSHTYHMGDADSKITARNACIQEARRAILEQAGTYSRVISEMRDFVVTHDVVQSISAGVIKTTLINEELSLVGQRPALTCTVAGEVDLAAMEAEVQRLRNSLPSPTGAGNGEDASRGDAAAANATPPPGSPTLPGSIPNQPDGDMLSQKLAKREQMRKEMRDVTFLARHLPEKGMTYEQIAELVGEPDGGLDGPRYQCRSHGRTWIVYRLGKVACVRRSLSWSVPQHSECHCDGFAGDFHLR